MAFVGIDASYFNPHSMCEELANGSHMNWEVDPESGNYKPLKNWTRSFKKENFIFWRVKPKCKLERVLKWHTEQKLIRKALPLFVVLGGYYCCCLCQGSRFSGTDKKITKKLVGWRMQTKIRLTGYYVDM